MLLRKYVHIAPFFSYTSGPQARLCYVPGRRAWKACDTNSIPGSQWRNVYTQYTEANVTGVVTPFGLIHKSDEKSASSLIWSLFLFYLGSAGINVR